MTNKQKILEIISSFSCPISAKIILEKLDNKVNKTTVYRNIEKLLLEELILEDFGENGEKLYSIKQNHHHHFICNICWKNIDIWCFLDENIRKLEEQFWFQVKNHSLVLNGICKECRS